MDRAKVLKGGKQKAEAEKLSRLLALGQSLSKLRTNAINGRLAFGVDQMMKEDEEHYEGIDDANRNQSASAWHTKPPGRANPKSESNRSVEFVNITRPYVDAAAAQVGEILVPTDEPTWSLDVTPLPEMLDKSKGKLPAPVVDLMAEVGVAPEVQQQAIAAEAQAASAQIAEMKERAKKASKRIEDWHIEGQWHAELRKVIDDCCRVGTGVLKGPIPENKTTTAWMDGKLVSRTEIKPVSRRVNPFNFFPDPGCGENMHDGSFVFERDYITRKVLEGLREELDEDDDPVYVTSQINECLQEGPQNAANRTTADGKTVPNADLFEIWYFQGNLGKDELEVAGCECPDGVPVSVPAMITLVNDRVIKARLSHLDDGGFTYDMIPWQRLANMPWGAGVGRQIRTPQRVVVAASRTMFTNAGRAAGPMFVIRSGVVTPSDGVWSIAPWKIFYAKETADSNDVRSAFTTIDIEDMQEPLNRIIQFGLKMAEDVTGLPLLLQGQAGSAPETLGGQQLVQKNASSVLRRIGRTFDDYITEPHLRRYYSYLLKHGPDDNEKGDFVLDARGSTALVEREIYKSEVTQLLQASLNPAFGISPEKAMAEHLRTTKKDPAKFQLTDEEKKQQAASQQGQQQPKDTSIEVATIRANTEKEKAAANQAADKEELAFKSAEADKQRAHDREMANLQYQTEILKFAQQRNIGIDKVKGQLAKTVMELRTQKELSGTEAATPPIEPRGRAPEGQSYQK